MQKDQFCSTIVLIDKYKGNIDHYCSKTGKFLRNYVSWNFRTCCYLLYLSVFFRSYFSEVYLASSRTQFADLSSSVVTNSDRENQIRPKVHVVLLSRDDQRTVVFCGQHSLVGLFVDWFRPSLMAHVCKRKFAQPLAGEFSSRSQPFL